MSQSKEFFNPQGLLTPPGYSHIAKVIKGTLIYTAGQVPCDASGKLVGEGDFGVQVDHVFGNVKRAVEAAGGTMADLVKITTYVVSTVDPTDMPKFRVARDRHVNVKNPPASTLLFVSRLAQPGWLVEIEAVAAIDG